MKEVVLEENERIVGFESIRGDDARHFDLQFVIAKLE